MAAAPTLLCMSLSTTCIAGRHVLTHRYGCVCSDHVRQALCVCSVCIVLYLCDASRVCDRLVMEQLMVEVLEEVSGRELLPDEAAAVMQLAGEPPHQLCGTACMTLLVQTAMWAASRHDHTAGMLQHHITDCCAAAAASSFVQVTFPAQVTLCTAVPCSSCSSR